jgi:hypothetical protein
MELALLSVATPPLTVIVIDPVFVRLVPDRSVYVLPAEVMPPTVRTLFSPDIVTAPPAPIVIVPELATLFESVVSRLRLPPLLTVRLPVPDDCGFVSRHVPLPTVRLLKVLVAESVTVPPPLVVRFLPSRTTPCFPTTVANLD